MTITNTEITNALNAQKSRLAVERVASVLPLAGQPVRFRVGPPLSISLPTGSLTPAVTYTVTQNVTWTVTAPKDVKGAEPVKLDTHGTEMEVRFPATGDYAVTATATLSAPVPGAEAVTVTATIPALDVKVAADPLGDAVAAVIDGLRIVADTTDPAEPSQPIVLTIPGGTTVTDPLYGAVVPLELDVAWKVMREDAASTFIAAPAGEFNLQPLDPSGKTARLTFAKPQADVTYKIVGTVTATAVAAGRAAAKRAAVLELLLRVTAEDALDRALARLLASVSVKRLDADANAPVPPGRTVSFRLVHDPLVLSLQSLAGAPAAPPSLTPLDVAAAVDILPPVAEAEISVSVTTTGGMATPVGTSFDVELPLSVVRFSLAPAVTRYTVTPTVKVTALGRTDCRKLPAIELAALPLAVPQLVACFRHPDFAPAWGNRLSRAVVVASPEVPRDVQALIALLKGLAATIQAMPAKLLDNTDWHLRLLLDNVANLAGVIAQQESTTIINGDIPNMERADYWMNDEISSFICVGLPNMSATFFADFDFHGGILEVILKPQYYTCAVSSLLATAITPSDAATLLGPYSTANDRISSIRVKFA